MPTAPPDDRPFDTLLLERRPPSRRESLQAERRLPERRGRSPLRLGATAVVALTVLGAGLTWAGQSFLGADETIQTVSQRDRHFRAGAGLEVGVRFQVTAATVADGAYVFVTDSRLSPGVRLWSQAGVLLDTGASRATSGTGWRKVSLRHTVRLLPGTGYLVSTTTGAATAQAASSAPPQALTGVTVLGAVSGRAGWLPSVAVTLTQPPVQVSLATTTTPGPTAGPPAAPVPSPEPSRTPSPTSTAAPAAVPPPTADPTGSQGTATGCIAEPHRCGYPDATNTGVPPGTALKSVPGEVSKGAGWHYDSRGWVSVDGSGAVLDGLNIPYNVDILASNVTIKNSRVTLRGESFGISVRHASNVTIEHNEISSPDAGAGRLLVAIKDIYSDSANLRVLHNDIWHVSTGVQIDAGLIQGNYIHDLGYAPGDHLNGTTSNGGSDPLTIRANTVLNQHDQTDAISLFEDFGRQANRVVDGNLVAGGGYTIYGGANSGGQATSNIKITNNRFARSFYPAGGSYGPVAAFDPGGSGNTWSGNVWDDTGAPVRP